MSEWMDFVGASMPKVVGDAGNRLNVGWALLAVCPRCGSLIEHEFSC